MAPLSLRHVLSIGMMLVAVDCGGAANNSSQSGVPSAGQGPAATLRRAEAGDAAQQAFLGYMYFHGDRVPQDYLRSYMWLNIAAARAPKETRSFIELMRAEVAKELTSAQIAEAQKRSSEWMDVFEKRQK